MSGRRAILGLSLCTYTTYITYILTTTLDTATVAPELLRAHNLTHTHTHKSEPPPPQDIPPTRLLPVVGNDSEALIPSILRLGARSLLL
jgi:hypothetical protein